ncbi:MAG: MBL fold metallo-hydrolase [Clostridia bacterium]|nr:MBL fold metallo-hydrolase [Clostridia bacterium]
MNLKEKILNTRLAEGQIACFYLGQVGFIVKYNETYTLIDGYLSDYVDKNCCSELVKWVRKYPAPIKGEELDFIDYVFCTHAHKDHADPYTLSAIASVNKKAEFFASVTFCDEFTEYGIAKDKIHGVVADKAYTLDGGISFTPVPAAHEQLNTDDNGNYHELGFVISFGETKVFHSGDCCMYDGLIERIKGSDILMIPINGKDYFRTVVKDIIGCFDSVEAITLAKEAGASLLIPTHFDLYSVNEVNPAYFVDLVYKLNPAQSFKLFTPGERYIFEK